MFIGTETIQVRPVLSRRDRARFVDWDYELHRGSPYWVPPLRADVLALLDPKQNPFFEHGAIQAFLAERTGGEIVGRVAAILNGRHLETYHDATGFFGFFECIEEPAVSTALLDAACEWLRGHGMVRVRGPVCPTMHEMSGVLISGFDRVPSIMMPYNPPYYPDLLRRYGFHPVMKMRAYYAAWRQFDLDRLARGARIVQRRQPGISLRAASLSRFGEEARLVHKLYDACFENVWGFVPMTEAEFDHLAGTLRRTIDPDFLLIVEDEGIPVGFSLSLPNISPLLQRMQNGRLTPANLLKVFLYELGSGPVELRTILIGLLPDYRGKGIDTLMVQQIVDTARRKGYVASEMSWVLDENKVLNNALRALGAVVDREYAMVELDLFEREGEDVQMRSGKVEPIEFI